MDAEPSPPPGGSTKETDDILRREQKKFKRRSTGEFIVSSIPNLHPSDIPSPQLGSPGSNPGVNGFWGNKSFSQVLVRGKSDLPFYEGSDDEMETAADGYLKEKGKAKEMDISQSKFPRVDTSDEDRREMWKPWRKALTLKVLGRNISFKILDQKLREIWKLQCEFEITDLENGFYIARFRSKEDYLRVLDGGPWVVQGHYVTVNQWKPGFRAAKEDVSSTLVWIRFPGLPVEYYSEKFLLKLGGILGRAVKVDAQTSSAIRGKFARVCVEIDLGKPLTPFIWIDDELQAVEYEGLNLICFECGQYGHAASDCVKNAKIGDLSREGVKTDLPNDTRREKGFEISPYGPWMVANTRRRKEPLGQKGLPQTLHSNHPSNIASSSGASLHSADSSKMKGKAQVTQKQKQLLNDRRLQQEARGTPLGKRDEQDRANWGSRFAVLQENQDDQVTQVQSDDCRTLQEKIRAIPEPMQVMNSRSSKKGKVNNTPGSTSSKRVSPRVAETGKRKAVNTRQLGGSLIQKGQVPDAVFQGDGVGMNDLQLDRNFIFSTPNNLPKEVRLEHGVEAKGRMEQVHGRPPDSDQKEPEDKRSSGSKLFPQGPQGPLSAEADRETEETEGNSEKLVMTFTDSAGMVNLVTGA